MINYDIVFAVINEKKKGFYDLFIRVLHTENKTWKSDVLVAYKNHDNNSRETKFSEYFSRNTLTKTPVAARETTGIKFIL